MIPFKFLAGREYKDYPYFCGMPIFIHSVVHEIFYTSGNMFYSEFALAQDLRVDSWEDFLNQYKNFYIWVHHMVQCPTSGRVYSLFDGIPERMPLYLKVIIRST